MIFTEFFKSCDKKLSCKRLVGISTILTALLVGMSASLFAIFIKIADRAFLEFFIGSCFFSGTALISAGIVEKFANKRNVTNDQDV